MYFGTISASDMLEIRQFILGNTTNFKIVIKYWL